MCVGGGVIAKIYRAVTHRRGHPQNQFATLAREGSNLADKKTARGAAQPYGALGMAQPRGAPGGYAHMHTRCPTATAPAPHTTHIPRWLYAAATSVPDAVTIAAAVTAHTAAAVSLEWRS